MHALPSPRANQPGAGVSEFISAPQRDEFTYDGHKDEVQETFMQWVKRNLSKRWTGAKEDDSLVPVLTDCPVHVVKPALALNKPEGHFNVYVWKSPLRKVGEEKLGLSFLHNHDERELVVRRIHEKPGYSSLSKWNNMEPKEFRVMVGDRIVAVNNVYYGAEKYGGSWEPYLSKDPADEETLDAKNGIQGVERTMTAAEWMRHEIKFAMDLTLTIIRQVPRRSGNKTCAVAKDRDTEFTGLRVARADEGNDGCKLIVKEILQGGLVYRWNQEHADDQFEQVWPGDTIVDVNGETEFASMHRNLKDCPVVILQLFDCDALCKLKTSAKEREQRQKKEQEEREQRQKKEQEDLERRTAENDARRMEAERLRKEAEERKRGLEALNHKAKIEKALLAVEEDFVANFNRRHVPLIDDSEVNPVKEVWNLDATKTTKADDRPMVFPLRFPITSSVNTLGNRDETFKDQDVNTTPSHTSDYDFQKKL